MRYQLTEAAKADIREITLHIRVVQKSPQNARLVAERLKRKFGQLVDAPQLGHVRDELGDPDALVTEVSGVIIIYDRTARPLTILRVIHASRDLNRVNARPR